MKRKHTLLFSLCLILLYNGFMAIASPVPGIDGDKLPAAIVPGGNTETFPVKLSCADTSSSVVTIDTCATSYTFHGTTYNQNGHYTQVFTNVAGCDSTVHLHLTLKMEKPVLTVEMFELGTTLEYSTYQWYRNDTAIAGATGRHYVVDPPLPGYYYVVVNALFCPDTSAYYVIPDDDDVNIGELERQYQVKVYPNPTSGKLTLFSPVPVSVQICSLDGRVLYSSYGSKILSLENLARGVYFIRITDVKGNQIKVERVVKE